MADNRGLKKAAAKNVKIIYGKEGYYEQGDKNRKLYYI